MNHFELFGLPIQFELDGSLLSTQFRELQKRFHPDNYSTASERDRLLAVQKAAQINDAYQILKDPISRIEYILTLNGLDLSHEKQTIKDPLFLMGQMELREELEEITSDDALFDFDSKVSKMYKEHLKDAVQELNNAQWEMAADGARKLKFIAKLKNEIERVEEKLIA